MAAAKKAPSENTVKVVNYLKTKIGVTGLTAATIGEALGLLAISVNGSINKFVKSGDLTRIKEELPLAEGEKKAKTITYVVVNPSFSNVDLFADTKVDL